MGKNNYFIIQINAALSLLGYYFISAVMTSIFGDSSRAISIGYRAFQAALSLYVIWICRRDFIIERGKSFFVIFNLMLFLYAIRMFIDMFVGPFAGILSTAVFWDDIMFIVFGVFFSAWAIVSSRKYLNVDWIVKLVFWMGLLIILLSRSAILGGHISYTDDRLNISRGLHSLALVNIGVIEVMASMHLLLNQASNKKSRIKLVKKFICFIGLFLGIWTTLASGSRGGVVSLVIALGLYGVFSSRKNIALILLAVVASVLVIINVVPILNWLSHYFPIVSNRLLITIIEGDEGNRELLRAQAYDFIMQNPILGYSYRLNTDITGFTTHNGILDVFLALGIPMGLLFIYTFYVKGFLMAIRTSINKQLFFPVIMAFTFLVSSMSGSSLTNINFLFSLALLAAVYYYDYKPNDQLIK